MVLVTDGSLGIGKGSLRHSLQTMKQRGDEKKFPLPFPFPCKMYIMCVANAEEVLNRPFLLAPFTFIYLHLGLNTQYSTWSDTVQLEKGRNEWWCQLLCVYMLKKYQGEIILDICYCPHFWAERFSVMNIHWFVKERSSLIFLPNILSYCQRSH